MTYQYKIFGLQISSEIPLPELIPSISDAIPDVSIRLDNIPKEIIDPRISGVLYQAKPGYFLLNIKGTVRYLVKKGKEIIISPEKDSLNSVIRHFLYSTPFAALLYQRGFLVLHASSFINKGQAIILAGASSSGKSSLAVALHQKGYPILSDEIVAISKDESGILWVQPGIPEVYLWDQAAKELKLKIESLMPYRDGIKKYIYRVDQDFPMASAQLKMIFSLNRDNKPHHQIRLLQGKERILALLRSTYLSRLVEGFGLAQTHLELIIQAVRQSMIFELRFAEHQIEIQIIKQVIEEEIKQWQKSSG